MLLPALRRTKQKLRWYGRHGLYYKISQRYVLSTTAAATTTTPDHSCAVLLEFRLPLLCQESRVECFGCCCCCCCCRRYNQLIPAQIGQLLLPRAHANCCCCCCRRYIQLIPVPCTNQPAAAATCPRKFLLLLLLLLLLQEILPTDPCTNRPAAAATCPCKLLLLLPLLLLLLLLLQEI